MISRKYTKKREDNIEKKICYVYVERIVEQPNFIVDPIKLNRVVENTANFVFYLRTFQTQTRYKQNSKSFSPTLFNLIGLPYEIGGVLE